MKKFAKNILTFMIISALAVFTVIPAFAANTLTVNGEDSIKLKKGDTVTYELCLADCDDLVEGLQMYIFYDKEYLTIADDTLKFPNLNGVVSNTNLENELTFNWTDVQNQADFSKSKCLATVDFQVQKPGESNITYFVKELYGNDMTYMKSFTFTYNLKLNGKEVLANAVPKVEDNAENTNKYQGSFTNYADGKGEQNGSGDEHVAVTGVTNPLAISATQAQEVLKGEDNTPMVITIIAIVLVIIAIIIVIVLRNNYVRNNSSGEEEQK